MHHHTLQMEGATMVQTISFQSAVEGAQEKQVRYAVSKWVNFQIVLIPREIRTVYIPQMWFISLPQNHLISRLKSSIFPFQLVLCMEQLSLYRPFSSVLSIPVTKVSGELAYNISLRWLFHNLIYLCHTVKFLPCLLLSYGNSSLTWTQICTCLH